MVNRLKLKGLRECNLTTYDKNKIQGGGGSNSYRMSFRHRPFKESHTRAKSQILENYEKD